MPTGKPAADPVPRLVFLCDWREVKRSFNAMLKPHGLKLKEQKTYDGDTRDDDQRYLSVVPLDEVTR